MASSKKRQRELERRRRERQARRRSEQGQAARKRNSIIGAALGVVIIVAVVVVLVVVNSSSGSKTPAAQPSISAPAVTDQASAEPTAEPSAEPTEAPSPTPTCSANWSPTLPKGADPGLGKQPTVPKPGAGPAPTTMQKVTMIPGTGATVKAGDTVTVSYKLALYDDPSKTIDSSWSRCATFPVENIGNAQVISGWNKGIVGLKVGSRTELILPPDEGYGATEQGEIPANSTLIFVVDVLDTQAGASPSAAASS